MRVKIQSVNFSIDKKLTSFIEKKMNKLGLFYEHIVDGEVFLRLNNEGVENKDAEIKLRVPGAQLFAKERAASFEEAVDSASEGLRRQLQKFKQKQEQRRTGSDVVKGEPG